MKTRFFLYRADARDDEWRRFHDRDVAARWRRLTPRFQRVVDVRLEQAVFGERIARIGVIERPAVATAAEHAEQAVVAAGVVVARRLIRPYRQSQRLHCSLRLTGFNALQNDNRPIANPACREQVAL